MASLRECLGWLTTCTDEKRCPMNWLELSTSELPTTIHCHVCDQDVTLTGNEQEFEAARQGLAAFPVVPPANLPASHGLHGGGSPPRAATQHQSNAAPPSTPAPSPPAGKARTEPPPRAIYCVLTSGDAVRLDKDSMVIGRSRNCDIVIPSAKVSRQHASISRVEGDFYIEDLGSANGVWINGEKISGRTKIKAGDVFNISEETLTFEAR